MTSHPNHHDSTPGVVGVPAQLARISSQVRGLTDTLWSARSRDELMDTVTEIEALKSTLEALELGVVRELDATNAVKTVGWASTQDFVTAVAGGHKGAGPATVRLATAVDQPLLAPVEEALRDGWLSVAKAQVIERAIDALPGNPDLRARAVQVLLGEAKALDATELRKLTRRLLTVVDPDGEDRRDEQALDRFERVAHLNRHLRITEDQAGGAWLTGRCTTEDAALIKAALIPLAAPTPSSGPVCDPDTCTVPGCGHDGRDPRDHGTRLLDALVEACQAAADRRGAARVTRRHPEVDPDDGPRGPAHPVRVRHHRDRRTAHRERRPADLLRLPDHPRGPRQHFGDPRRRPHATPGHRRHLESPRGPGPALPVPELHPTADDVPRPPHRSTGSTEARPAWATCSCSADTTTASSTPARGPSDKPDPPGSSSTHHLAAVEPPEPDAHHPTTDATRPSRPWSRLSARFARCSTTCGYGRWGLEPFDHRKSVYLGLSWVSIPPVLDPPYARWKQLVARRFF